MTQGFSRGIFAASVTAALFVTHTSAREANRPSPDIVQRFLSLDDPTPQQFRALRHLAARNDKFEKSAWMDVWTEGDSTGFRYDIVSEEGSDYIRSKVFRATLEREREVWAAGGADQGALTTANYEFEERGAQADGLASVAVKPRRKGLLLVDGSIYLNPGDGELVRMEGLLTKTPSFWTRHVKIVRWYQRIAGFRMPTQLETVASVRIAGESTFRMTYDYESIDGQRVGNPQPRTAARAPSR